MKVTERDEDYLKYIYILSKTQAVRGVRLAEALGVSKPTVSIALKKLEKDGYIEIAPDHTVSLTPEGTKIAQQVTERHLTFENLLIRLGVDKQVAHEDACDMEHTVSHESFQALKKMIDGLDTEKDSE